MRLSTDLNAEFSAASSSAEVTPFVAASRAMPLSVAHAMATVGVRDCAAPFGESACAGMAFQERTDVVPDQRL